MARKQLGMVDDALLADIDAAAERAGMTRRAFTEQALEAALGRTGGGVQTEPRKPASPASPRASAVEATPPDETPRPSPAGRNASTEEQDGFADWLAGFIDGEGSFTISRNTLRGVPCGYRCRMTLRLRDDDRAVLDMAASRTGIGSVRQDKPRNGDNPQVAWEVASKAGCVELCRLLDAHPLRAKKARDYAIWREAVAVWQRVTGRNQNLGEDPAQAELAALKMQLENGRAYKVAAGVVGSMGASRPVVSPRRLDGRRHHPRCVCPICKPAAKGAR